MATGFSDGLVYTALQRAGYAALTVVVRLNAARRALAALSACAAASLASAVPSLRPLLAVTIALPPIDHIGSRPRPPSVLGVAISEQIDDSNCAAAAEALGMLLSWAHGHGFGLALLHEAAGSLQQPHHMRQLELQLLQRRLTGAVQLQAGWQVHEGAGAASEASTDAQLKAVLLSAAEGQWPLLAVARHTRTGTPRAEAADAAAAEGVVATDGATDGCGGTAAAIDAAIQAPARLRRRLQAVAGTLAGAEPDFVLVTGPALTLGGFPAWCVRASEIYGVGPLAELDADKLQAAMARFCTTKQRFGK
ncbi:hypothetical protein ACK3TF_003123 [Chlorella vulgaris]